MRITSLCK